jgi:DnaK suppressor protein
MTRTDLASFKEVLRIKQAELSGTSRNLESIAIERSPEELEEAQLKCDRELVIAGLNRDSAMRRDVQLALVRINDHSFGTCLHCGEEISKRRLEAVPWTPLCIRCREAADLGDESVLESVGQVLLDAA